MTETPATGQSYRPYDLVKEFVIALGVVVVLTVGLAVVFSSPDDRPITLASWSNADPNDFVATSVTELDGTSATATYGPPYTTTSGAAQRIGPLSPQQWAGVRHPVDTAHDFVLDPLERASAHDPLLSLALQVYATAPSAQERAWTAHYSAALAKAPGGDPTKVPAGDYGPVPVMMGRLLGLAQAGGLDGTLQSEGGVRFYQTDYTRPLLYLSDGSYLESRARAQHLAGDQWGMMNETGNYPGQAWLWLYTFWYQVPPFSSSANADALVWGVMAVLTLALVLLPFIPGLRSIPRLVPVYRLIWRDHYRRQNPPR
ncbi:hypothetical protein [Actinocatenispora rupis]|uniref:Uncharacterized protein n=1 Tax=Actinocatenispora rupis TaxID=519421 RepID=A0A8J3J645_9ACTN|nr:hypothetical protein [Actinocatenispora rupis]GID15510.1 hypothetical protein Aru02nite_63990 [Actinocatenispora rupis]